MGQRAIGGGQRGGGGRSARDFIAGQRRADHVVIHRPKSQPAVQKARRSQPAGENRVGAAVGQRAFHRVTGRVGQGIPREADLIGGCRDRTHREGRRRGSKAGRAAGRSAPAVGGDQHIVHHRVIGRHIVDDQIRRRCAAVLGAVDKIGIRPASRTGRPLVSDGGIGNRGITRRRPDQ